MSDPRYVPPRCEHAFIVDRVTRATYRCEFGTGHAGLHCAGSGYVEGYFDSQHLEVAMRWGSEAEMLAEVALAILEPTPQLMAQRPELLCPLSGNDCRCELSARCDLTLPSMPESAEG